MLVRITRDQARIGMFVVRLEGTWMDHPFWTNRFLLGEFEDVAKLRNSDVSTIVIDVTKGVGVAAPSTAPDTLASVFQVVDGDPSVTSKPDFQRIERALGQSRRTVEALFTQARDGRPLETEQAAALVAEISEATRRNPVLLIQITRLKSKDEATFIHSIAVCALLVQFARYLRLDEAKVQTLGLAGLLHDIGKVGLPHELLNKADRLTPAETRLVRTHPAEGRAILANVPELPDLVREICLNHHERIDGRGYPNGLKGDEIGMDVRMTSICDVYDALTSVRSYRSAWSSSEALTHMLAQVGQFDRLLLLQFAASLGMRLNREAPVSRQHAAV